MLEVSSSSKGEIHELVCPACGFVNLVGEKYCSECGESLNRERETPVLNTVGEQIETEEEPVEITFPVIPKTVVCRFCGTETNFGKKYCAECGSPLVSHTNPNQKVAATQSAVRSRKNASAESPPPPPPSSSLLPPNSVLQGRYQITRLIGQGGMGAIYLAADLRFANRVAVIKEMLDHFTDQEQRRLATLNFEREAEMLANLNHMGIPEVYDRFNEGNRHYLVMEYVDGVDLEHKLIQQQKPFEENEVLDWAIQICEILRYMHNKDSPIIYRDMKPANLILTKEGRIYVVDFGIARHFNPIKKGTMIGTQGYAPPEQYRGQVEPRSDLYALGATMHHMLTARDPQAEAPFTFPPVRQLNNKLSVETERMIMRCLSMEPEDRYKNAQDMLDALIKISVKYNHQSIKVCPWCHSKVSVTQPFCPSCNHYLSTYKSGKIPETAPIVQSRGISTVLMKMGVSQKLFSTEWLLRINVALLLCVIVLLIRLLQK